MVGRRLVVVLEGRNERAGSLAVGERLVALLGRVDVFDDEQDLVEQVFFVLVGQLLDQIVHLLVEGFERENHFRQQLVHSLLLDAGVDDVVCQVDVFHHHIQVFFELAGSLAEVAVLATAADLSVVLLLKIGIVLEGIGNLERPTFLDFLLVFNVRRLVVRGKLNAFALYDTVIGHKVGVATRIMKEACPKLDEIESFLLDVIADKLLVQDHIDFLQEVFLVDLFMEDLVSCASAELNELERIELDLGALLLEALADGLDAVLASA